MPKTRIGVLALLYPDKRRHTHRIWQRMWAHATRLYAYDCWCSCDAHTRKSPPTHAYHLFTFVRSRWKIAQHWIVYMGSMRSARLLPRLPIPQCVQVCHFFRSPFLSFEQLFLHSSLCLLPRKKRLRAECMKYSICDKCHNSVLADGRAKVCVLNRTLL